MEHSHKICYDILCSFKVQGDIIMNNRAVNISSLVILLSLVSFIAEACLYYLINYHWVSIFLLYSFPSGFPTSVWSHR